MVSGTKTPQGVRLNPQNTLELSQGMSIQAAINTADAHGGFWVILLYPSTTYDEGDLATNGGALITIRGMDDHVMIAPAVAPVTAVVNITDTLYLENLTIIAPDATRPAVLINTAAGAPTITDCAIVGVGAGYSLQMTQGFVGLTRTSFSADTHLSTAICTIEAWHCDFLGDLITAGAFAHDIDLMSCNMTHGDIISNATGATVIICDGTEDIGTVTNAGTGLFQISGGYVDSINCTNVAGSVRIRGGNLNSITRAVGSVVWWKDNNTLQVIPSDTITDTIIGWAVAAAGAGDTILINPGTYEEAVVLAAGINLKGVDKEACIINIDHAVLITMAEGCSVSSLSLDVTCDVTASGTGIELNDAACTIEDVNIVLHRPAAGLFANGILESTGATARIIHIRNVRCSMSNDTNERGIAILQAGKTVYIENSWIQGSDYGLAIGVSGGGAVASTIYTTLSHFEATSATSRGIFCNGGTIRMNGDSVTGYDHSGGCFLRENNGIITYKNGPREYEVWVGMSAQDAITTAAAETTAPSAAAPYTILVHPGIYTQALIMEFWINLKGVGPAGSVVIYQDDADVINGADHTELENLTVRLGTISGGRQHIGDGGNVLNITLRRVIFEVVAPGAFAVRVMAFDGAGTYTVIDCSFNIGGTGVSYGLRNNTAAGTFRLINNDFTFTNVNSFIIGSIQAGTWTGEGNRFNGTGAMFSATAGTFTFDSCEILAPLAWTNTGTSITLRHATILSPIVAGNLAIVRLSDCSYRAIQRAGTGNIVDESPVLKDAPWHVQRWSWMSTLAQSQVSVRGTPVDAGTGQVLLEVTDNVADVEAVESGTEAAGSLSNKLTPARTPRFITQISVDSFDAHVTMFFGLRETLGDAVPAATEDHAGFIWDGTNFKSSSDDGVGIQENNLAEPSTGTLHQLEVIVFGGVTTVGWVEFYVDGLLVQTHVTRIPVNDLDWQHLLPTAGGGGGDEIDVTVRAGGVQQCPA